MSSPRRFDLSGLGLLDEIPPAEIVCGDLTLLVRPFESLTPQEIGIVTTRTAEFSRLTGAKMEEGPAAELAAASDALLDVLLNRLGARSGPHGRHAARRAGQRRHGGIAGCRRPGRRRQKKVDPGASIGLLDACLLAARGYPGTSLTDWISTFPVALLRRALAQLGALDARDSLRTASAVALGSGHLPDAERRRIIVDAEGSAGRTRATRGGLPDPRGRSRLTGCCSGSVVRAGGSRIGSCQQAPVR